MAYTDFVAKLLLDRYRIISQLGEGGSAAVLLAFDQRIARRVAIKRLELAEDQKNAQASLREARIAALLQHPHIVQILDFEIVESESEANVSAAYLIMEYLDGVTLDEVPSDALDADIIAAVIEAIGDALTFAHSNGVLHLDVKPNNILIDRNGQIKLADFGLSLLSDLRGHRQAAGGTVGYMPLEQLRGQRPSAATDQWALAAVLYELCADEYPYFSEIARHPTVARLLAAQVAGEAPLLELRAPGLTDVFARALMRDPAQRYDSVADFCAELSPYFGDPAKGVGSLRELCRELTADDEDTFDDDAQAAQDAARSDARAQHGARQQRRASKRGAQAPRGASGWLGLTFSLLAVLSGATALAGLLTPNLITQLFGDKRLVIGVASVSFFILVSLAMLLIRAAHRRRN